MTASPSVPCYRCGGEMETGTTNFCYTQGRHTLVFENVPALICSECHESSLDGPAFDIIQRVVREDCPPTRTVEVGVYDLAAAPYAAEMLRS
jgi:YgiT-type zinc finger domain-containing protein